MLGGSNRSRRKRAIDSRVIVEEESYYTEETAWRCYGGRHDAEANQNFEPLPKAPPINTSKFPSRWTFNEVSRVVFGDFTDHPHGLLEPKDCLFLLQMMERDDVTVVTQGFSSRLDSHLWSLDTFENIVGNDVCHQFRVFERCLVLQADNYYESFEERGRCCSMVMKDYFRYIRQRNEQLKNIAQRILMQSALKKSKETLSPSEEALYRNATDELFSYSIFNNGETRTMNCIDNVLYLIDYDLAKLLPVLNEDFKQNFLAPQLLPAGQFCLMQEVSLNVTLFLFFILFSFIIIL
jgi:hypothetical protein